MTRLPKRTRRSAGIDRSSLPGILGPMIKFPDPNISESELRGSHKRACARLHFGTMQPQIAPTALQTGAARLPWDARSPIASRGPNAAPHPLFRGFEDRIDALKANAGALEAALAEEDSVGAELWRRIKERESGSARVAGKRKVSMCMPPPGQTESFARIMAHFEALAEAPRKKRRLDFPPPTAHETSRVA